MSDFTPHEAPIREAQALPVTPPTKLVGRETALAQVYGQLKENNPVLVYGPSGAGKTALAATLAAAYTQQPGGVLWLQVNDPSLDTLLAQVGRAYKVDEVTHSETPTAMIGAVASTLSANRPFIVVDGAIDEDVLVRFVTRCVEGMPILIATEPKLEGPWAALELNKLEPEQATMLFKQETRLTTNDHDIDIYGLVKMVNYMPLGIVIAARGMILAKQPPGEYLKVVQQMATQTGGNGPLAAITASFRSLTGALQGLVLMMGATFNGQVSSELLSMISGAPLQSVQQAMNILSQVNMIVRTQRYGLPYYHMHPLVYAFAQASLRGSGRLDGLQNEKIRDSVLQYAQKYSNDAPESYDKLATEMEMFLAVARHTAHQENREVASQLVAALTGAGGFIRERGYLYELLQLREYAAESSTAFPAYADDLTVGIVEDDEIDEMQDDDEAVDAGAVSSAGPEDALAPSALPFDDDDDDDEAFDDDDEAIEEDDLAPEEIDLTTDDVTRLRTALGQARQAGDKQKEIDVLKAIGQVHINRGQEKEAISSYDEVLDIYEEMDDKEGTLDTLDMLSSLMVKTDNAQAAVLHARRGINLAQEQGDKDTQMHLLITLGDAHQQLGESKDATQDYSQALEIARTTDDKQNEAIILYKLGYAQLDNNDTETAIDNWDKALARFKSQDKRDYEGKTLGALGSAYGEMERWSEAMNFHTSALHIAREVGDKEDEALQLSSLAYAAIQANKLGDAVLRYRQALHLAYEAEDTSNIVSTILDLARLLMRSRRHTSVAELIVDDALAYESNDKDLNQLKEQINSVKALAEAEEVALIPVNGTAKTYAANAYRLLEE